jgi:ribosomal protein S18 acetylase RimI-like enzyme
LGLADAREFRRLRLIALQESPAAFGSSYREEARRPVAAFRKLLERRANNWVFGSLHGEQLQGVVRLVRERGRKERHKANLYGLYVAPAARRQGIARRLLDQALATAGKQDSLRQIRVAVVASNAAARALYAKAGFVEYGREADALLVAGRFHAELLLVKRLHRSRRRSQRLHRAR